MADALDLFNTYYEPAKRHQDAMASVWQDYENAYLGESEDDSKPSGIDSWRSYMRFKYGWQQVQTLVAELASDDDPSFDWEARNHAQDEYACVVEKIVGYDFQRDNYPDKRYMALLTAAVYGGCPIKIHWDYRKAERHNPVTRQPEHICIADQPTMTLVDPRDFFYDTRARSMRDCRYVFHRMHLSLEELQARTRADGSPLYSNLDELSDNRNGAGDYSNTLDHDYSGERDKARRDGIEVIEMWTRDRIIVRAGGGTIIRDEENPYKHGRIPFEIVTLLPSLNDAWGLSVMWTLRDVQELLHTLDNASMDALKLAINPPLAVDITDDVDNADRALYPGQRFPSRTPKDAVVPIRVTGTEPFVNQQAIQAVRDQLEYVTGITREVAGQSNAGTATQAALNQRQSKGRLGAMLRNVDAAFARIAEMFLQLNQQYLDLSKPVRLLGDNGKSEWRLIVPTEIAGAWDVRPKSGTERAVKELHRQNLMEALNAVMPANGIIFPSGKTVDVSPIVEKLIETFDIEEETVLVDGQAMLDQHARQTIAEAHSQAEAQQIMAPQQPPPNMVAGAQAKLFESINYKDLPDAAQAAMLQTVGLPADGVENDNRNPTRPNAGGPVNPISEGLLAHSSATHNGAPGA